MRPCLTPLQMVQFGLWNRFTSVTAVFSIRWPTVWSLITRLPKTFYKMHSWPYGDIPPPILHKQEPLAVGSSPSYITAPLTIYAVYAVAPPCRKHHYNSS